ncbi:unnamed protein product [Auanema sp. JU1783]|nr:unnamed protein product [Auanema sp. JU1783]
MLTAAGRRFSRCAVSPRPRNRNYTFGNLPPPPAISIRTHDMINPKERRFIEASERGDKPTLLELLQQKKHGQPLNVNALDIMGRSALEIAVDNENLEVVELLLQQDGIRIGNALLCAIREGVYKIVEMLVNHPSITPEMLGEGWSQHLDPAEAAGAEYPSDISPIILAAQLNHFEILGMFIQRKALIEKPHRHACICETCDKERLNDSLQHSLKRINKYRALASPAWMSLTSPDPIKSAFKLSWELRQLALVELEFKEVYLKMANDCNNYAVALLNQCRSSEELIAVLNKDNTDNNEVVEPWSARLSLSRLKLAIKYEQKAFVSHAHCQQLLTSIWYEGFPGRQQRGSVLNIVICAFLVFLWPVFSISYILMPKSRIGRIVRSPFMKFLYYSISFGCFLLLLTLATFESYRNEKGEVKGSSGTRASDRGPPPSMIESLVVAWVLGMLWSEIKQLWEEGFKKYVHQWWNWLDFIMICLYLSTISIRMSSYYLYEHNSNRFTVRSKWNAYEPMLVAEALFAVGNVFSFARIIYLFQTNPYLGPLQISLGCMLVDVAKFCFIFVLIISSFSIGLAQLYWYYDPDTPVCMEGKECERMSNVFSSIADSYLTLLWALFSITKVEDTNVIENHHFTQSIGRGLFIMYHCTSIIVLLNMLIAMMSHSFQNINDHADLEWKFHRTKLWMAHFDEGSSLPPPFNIVITPKAIWYAVCSIMNTVRWLLGKYTYTKSQTRATIRRPGYSRKRNELDKNEDDEESQKPLTYRDIIARLVARYIHQTMKNMKMDGVNEDDLHEIKQDISSLRYELRDDRQREIQRSSSHIDSVKRDIMRTMSSTRSFCRRSTRSRGGISPRLTQPRASVAEESEGLSTCSTSDAEEDQAKDAFSDTTSLLFAPPNNSKLPEILESQPVIDESRRKNRRCSDTSGYIRPSEEKSRRSSESASNKRNSVSATASASSSSTVPLHSALRKTDTSYTFPSNGIFNATWPGNTEITSSKKESAVRTTDDIASWDAINSLRADINRRLDDMISVLIEKEKKAVPRKTSLSLSPARRCVGFSEFP